MLELFSKAQLFCLSFSEKLSWMSLSDDIYDIGLCLKMMCWDHITDDMACKLLRTVQCMCHGRMSVMPVMPVTEEYRGRLRDLAGLCNNLIQHQCKGGDDEVSRLALLDVAGRFAMLAGDFQAAANVLIRRAAVPSDGGVPGSRRECLLFVVSFSLAHLRERGRHMPPAAPPRQLTTWAELSPMDPTDPCVKNVLCFGCMLVRMDDGERTYVYLMMEIAEVQARSGKLAAALEYADRLLRLPVPLQMNQDRVEVLAMLLLKARVHRKMGQLDTACACFNDALLLMDHDDEETSRSLVVRIERVSCLLEAGMWAEALQRLLDHNMLPHVLVRTDVPTHVLVTIDVTEPHTACWALLGAPWHASPGPGPNEVALHCDLSYLRLLGYAGRRSCQGLLAEVARLRGECDLQSAALGLLTTCDPPGAPAQCASIIADAHLRNALDRCQGCRFAEAAQAAEMAVTTPMLEKSHMWRCALAVRAWCALLAGKASNAACTLLAGKASNAACALLADKASNDEDEDEDEGGYDDGSACLVRYARVCRLLTDCRSAEALALHKQGVQFSPPSGGDEGGGGNGEASRVQRILDGVRERCGASATSEDLLVCCMINSCDAEGALPLLEASGGRWAHETRRSTLHALNYARLTCALGDVMSAALNFYAAWLQAGACVAGELWVRTYLQVPEIKRLKDLSDGCLRTAKLLKIRNRLEKLVSVSFLKKLKQNTADYWGSCGCMRMLNANVSTHTHTHPLLYAVPHSSPGSPGSPGSS